MASIRERNNKFCVTYSIWKNGKRSQPCETYATMEEAESRKRQIDFASDGFIPKKIETVSELLDEFIEVYGVAHWSASTYSDKVSRINNYIRPYIGKIKLSDLNTRGMDEYYKMMLRRKSKPAHCQKKSNTLITPRTVLEIHKILNPCFKQGVRWGYLNKNPVETAELPKMKTKTRQIWDDDEFKQALDTMKDDYLKLAIHLGFAGTLRVGEVVGLCWDKCFIEDEDIENGTAHIVIERELRRVREDALIKVGTDDVFRIFPSLIKDASTVLVLKTPKTEGSVRKILLPKTVASMLQEARRKQKEAKVKMGSVYNDYDLVFAFENGNPIDGRIINKQLNKFCKENGMPLISFHAFRHMGTTFKMKVTNGDVKAVQADTGHKDTKMMLDVYAHTQQKDRVSLVNGVEEKFYKGLANNSPACDYENPMDKFTQLMSESPEFAVELSKLMKEYL